MRLLIIVTTFFLSCFLSTVVAQQQVKSCSFDFFGEQLILPFNPTKSIELNDKLSASSVKDFYAKMEIAGYEPLIRAMLLYQGETQ
ncbi:MAG TPA: hypothetical protein PL009_07075 [Flavipsychrobacter sp.]|nr:hypothetical protein [Flavipsychrobacter sp.]